MSAFLSLWPSSARRRPTSVFPNRSDSIRSRSYDTITIGVTTALPFAEHHWLMASAISGPVCLPSIASGLVAPSPSHLTSSLAQLRTSDEGHTTMALSIAGLPGMGDCFNRVHISAMH